jgi:hypothetical protein
MDQHQEIINLIKSTPAVRPPDDFTPGVMARLPEFDQGFRAKVKHALFHPSGAGVQSRWAQLLPVTNTRECSFCFFITGVFYLIMGIVLMAGFEAIGSRMAAMEWIKLQPHVTLGIAVLLIFLGAALLMQGKNTIKMIRLGTILYIFLAIVNGGLMHRYFSIPYAGIFIFGFIGTGVLMGVMLSLAIQKVELTLQ